MARDVLNDTNRYQVIGGLISPTSDEYKKIGLISSAHRLAMCKLAVKDSDWIDVDEWEVLQSSYTRTLAVLRSVESRIREQLRIDRVEIMLLAGSDLIKSFEMPGAWSLEDRMAILGNYGCVVVERCNSDMDEFIFENDLLYRFRRNIHIVRQHISNDISSTKIRLFLARGLSVKYLIPDAVLEYIKKNSLFLVE